MRRTEEEGEVKGKKGGGEEGGTEGNGRGLILIAWLMVRKQKYA